jgi:hypothetical protein
MKTSSAKAKGRKLQQLVRDKILEIFSSELSKDDVRSTSMGAQGEDVQLSPKAREILPYAIETKSRRRIAVYRYYEQAQEHAEEAGQGTKPLVVIKENGKDPLVLVDMDLFFKLTFDTYQHWQQYIEQQREESKVAALLRKRNDQTNVA